MALIDDPYAMIKGIVMLAPELNMKVALLNLVDYIRDTGDEFGDDEDFQISLENMLEVVVQSLTKLSYDLDDGFYVGGVGDNKPITETDVEEFKKMLGIVPDTNKEEEE